MTSLRTRMIEDNENWARDIKGSGKLFSFFIAWVLKYIRLQDGCCLYYAPKELPCPIRCPICSTLHKHSDLFPTCGGAWRPAQGG